MGARRPDEEDEQERGVGGKLHRPDGPAGRDPPQDQARRDGLGHRGPPRRRQAGAHQPARHLLGAVSGDASRRSSSATQGAATPTSRADLGEVVVEALDADPGAHEGAARPTSRTRSACSRRAPSARKPIAERTLAERCASASASSRGRADDGRLGAAPGGGRMISIETMKYRAKEMVGKELPLVFWRGKARIAAADDTSIALLVRGQRVDLTWDRLTVTWKRLLSDFTLTVDELGGQADAVGVVSLFAFMQADTRRRGRRRRAPRPQGARGQARPPVRRRRAPLHLGSLASQDPRRLTRRPSAGRRRDPPPESAVRVRPCGRRGRPRPECRTARWSNSRLPTASAIRSGA